MRRQNNRLSDLLKVSFALLCEWHFFYFPVSACASQVEIYIITVAGSSCRKESIMFKVIASEVVVSKGFDNKPAIKFSEKGDFVRFRIGTKVYDSRADKNHRWINVGVKAFGPLCERIRKMQLKEGSFVTLIGRYDEDIWEDEKTKEKRSVPVIILEDIEYCFSGGSKNSGEGKNATSSAPEPANNYAAPPASDPMNGGFTGFQSYGGGNSFF